MVEDNIDIDCSESIVSNTEAAYLHSVTPDPQCLDLLDNPHILEDGRFSITEQKKYYEFQNPKGGGVFIKQNLMPSEYVYNIWGKLLLPYLCIERIKNEVAAIRYIQSHTNIPTLNIHCAFEDHGYYYIITDLVPGVPLKNIPDNKKEIVVKELQGYISEMHAIKSNIMGGFAGNVILPYCIGEAIPHDQALKFHDAPTPKFVLCHNDLSQTNILVDETTFKINAIIAWKYTGFFPPEFDGAFIFILEHV